MLFPKARALDVARGAVGSKAVMGWFQHPMPGLAVATTKWLVSLNTDLAPCSQSFLDPNCLGQRPRAC